MAANNPQPAVPPVPPPMPNFNPNANPFANANANAPLNAPPNNPPYPPGTIINGVNMTGLAPASNPNPIPPNFQAANTVQPSFTLGFIHPNALSTSALLVDVIARESARAIQSNIGSHYFLSPSANPAEDIDPTSLTDLKQIWKKEEKDIKGCVRRISRYEPMEEIIALWPELMWPQEVLDKIFLNGGKKGEKDGGERDVEEMGRLLMEYLPGESDWEKEMKRKKEAEKVRMEMGVYERPDSTTGGAVRIRRCGERGNWDANGGGGKGGGMRKENVLGDKDPNGTVSIYDMDFTQVDCPSVSALGFNPTDGSQLINAMSVDDKRFVHRIHESHKPEYDVFAVDKVNQHKAVYGGGNTPMGLDYSNGDEIPNAILMRQQIEFSKLINEKAEKARMAAIERIKLEDAMKEAKEARDKNIREGKLRNPTEPHDEPSEDRAIRLSLHKAQKVRERHLSSPLYPENSQEREIHLFDSQSEDHLARNWQAQHIQAQLRHAQLRSHQQHHQQQQQGQQGHNSVMIQGQGNEWVQLPGVPISEHTTPHLAMFRNYRRDMERRGGS